MVGKWETQWFREYTQLGVPSFDTLSVLFPLSAALRNKQRLKTCAKKFRQAGLC